jgi:hypothetical protein
MVIHMKKIRFFTIVFILYIIGCTHNYEPVISSIVAEPNPVAAGDLVTLKCNASDDDASSTLKDEELTYEWYAASGEIVLGESLDIASWTAPTQAGYYSITCKVTDQYSGSDIETINVEVQ